MNNKNWFYHAHQGVQVTKDFTAEIGLEFGPDNELSFYLDSEAYENFTVSEDGIEGDEIEAGSAPASIAVAFLDPVSNTDTMDANYSPRSGYNIGDHIKVAIYMTDPTTETTVSYSYPAILFYNSDNDTFLGTYYNPSNVYVTNLDINSTTKIKTQWLQSGGTTVNEEYRISRICGPNKYGINNTWVNNDLFYGLKFATNIPVFDTEAHAKAYLRDSSALDGLLNGSEEDPAEKYKNSKKFWWIKNRIGHNTNVGYDYSEFRNYRFYPISDERICWYPKTPTSASPYDVILKGYTGYNVFKANTPYAVDDDDFNLYAGFVDSQYLRESIEFDANDFYTVFQFDTNIPKFETEADADDYIAGLRDITTASNWDDIARYYNDIIRPPYGDEDTGNDNGVNGQSYVNGVRMYVIGSLMLNTFFSDVFDPDYTSAILDGLQLFGANQISCIQSLTYFPLDIDDVATVNASQTPIKLGSWECPHATGRYIQNNNKMIDCGGWQCTRVYNDFRDYEIRMVLQLPYVGFREVKIADLLDKYVSIKYSVDITSGACSAHIYANSIEIACFDGYMASQRPIQSIDQTTYLSNVLGAVTGVVSPIPESLAGKAGAVIQGVSGNGAGAISQGAGSLTSVAIGKTALNAFGLEQTIKDVPMNTRGGFAGCLGYFAWQKIHIHTYISKSYKPALALQNIGAPSGVGGAVGMFSGFLSTSFFQIADSFTGTQEELNEIYNLMAQGIYL